MDLWLFKLLHLNTPAFECPICGYQGPFRKYKRPTGIRLHAKCPSCGAMERHRNQYVVVRDLLKTMDTKKMKMLHFAPEPFLVSFFKAHFGVYERADLLMDDVEHLVDIQQLPFPDQTYDVVYASHVLEHIPDDNQAISEVRRILKPGGLAVLPVPMVVEKTIDYAEPNPYETYHMRAPGYDYTERYARHFSRVLSYTSDDIPERYQPFIYEDRTRWPSPESPLRPAMAGKRHRDVVPVCYV